MKIYVVAHHYDNGESFEDYRTYVDNYYFSTLDKGYAFYASKIQDGYEGMYRFFALELDTQREYTIERSPWIDCTSIWES